MQGAKVRSGLKLINLAVEELSRWLGMSITKHLFMTSLTD